MNPIFYIDFYKVGHVSQYPSDVTQVWSNWTPRSTRVPNKHRVVNAGLTYLCKRYLISEFREHFFKKPLCLVLEEYRDVMRSCLGVASPRTDHIEWLHELGYLPICIYSLPEGFSVPLKVPPIIITNTLPEGYWLPNYLETLLSAILWKISTSATTAQRYRKVFTKYALEAGETDLGFIDWMGHDFSMRGMSGIEDATLSGMGHLMSFSGTDTVPAILAAREYYGAELTVGGSVPATEHSVMSAGGEDDELETFRRLIEDVYPTGVVSIVSDTWDLWRVLTKHIPALKDKILAREGKLVIRPDSGDPVKIICGDGDSSDECVAKGTLRLLADALGTTGKMINGAGAIYGDSITVERAEEICRGIVEMGLSPYNMVFGIGSYTYEYVTRDTYGWAMKATAVRRGDGVVPIFKKPVTDDGGKFSHRGILAVYRTEDSSDERPDYFVVENATEAQLDDCAYEKVFVDGQLLIDPTFDQIRKRVRV